MSPFDRTVGGIASLMPGHGDVDQPGAFEFAQRSEPVLRMAAGGYSQGWEEDFPEQEQVIQQAPDNSAALTQIYQDVLGRAPDQSGYQFWLNAMNTQGYTPEMVKNQFLSSPEYKQKQTQQQTQQTIGGLPSSQVVRASTTPGVNTAVQSATQQTTYQPPSGARADWRSDYNPDLTTLPTGFNWQNYLAKNPDLTSAGIDTETEAKRHWLLFGRNENRPGSVADFSFKDILDYANKNLATRPDAVIPESQEFGPSFYSAYGGASSSSPAAYLGTYTIRAIGDPIYEDTITGYDESGMPIMGQKQVGSNVTGYTIDGLSGKTDKGVNYTGYVNVDKAGNVTGRYIDYKTGNDSGVTVMYGPNGEIQWQNAYDESESWRRPVSIGLAALGAMVGLPEIGSFLSAGALSGAGAAALGGAALGGAGAAVAGKEGSDIFKAAGKGAVTGGLGTALNDAELLKSVGIDTTLTQGTNALGQNIANVTGLDQAGDAYSAIRDAVAGGSKAVVQQGLASLLTGQKFDPTVAFIGGGASNAVNKYLLSNDQFEKLPENLKNAVTGAITAGALGKNPTAAAVNAFVSNLFKDTSAIKTLSGNPGGTKAILDTLSPLTEVGGADLNDYINELLSMADLSVPEKTQLMNDIETLIIQNSRYKYGDDFVDNLLSDIYKQTGGSIGQIGETVDVTGGKFKKTEDEVIQNLIDQYTTPGQTVDVTGKYLDKGTAEDQTVDVTGKYLDKIEDQTVDVTDKYLDKGDQQVTVRDKKIVTEPDDITNQKVEVTDSTKDLKELDTVGGINIDDLIKDIPGKVVVPDKITPGTTTKTTTPGTTTTTPSWSFTPIPTSEGKMLPYQLANVFYGNALEYGPGAESMASPSDFQGQKRKAERAMELALDGRGGENEANNAADAILAMAEQDPGATVDELMNIVQGGRYA